MAFPYFQVLIICLLGVQFCVFIYNALSYPKPVVLCLYGPQHAEAV